MKGEKSIMKTRMLIMLALIATLVLAASASGVACADEAVVPFKAYYAGVPVAKYNPTCGCLDQIFEFDGNATHLGLSHFSATGQASLVPPPPMPQSGDGMITAADGDLLYIHYEGGAKVVSPGVFEYDGDFWIIGGTGRFEGATGELDYWGTATAGVWGELYLAGMLYK
jgi:hypothetical protein